MLQLAAHKVQYYTSPEIHETRERRHLTPAWEHPYGGHVKIICGTAVQCDQFGR